LDRTADVQLRTAILVAIAGALAAEPASAAALGTATAPGIPWLRIVFAFAFCIGVAFAAVWLLRMHRQGKIAQSAAGWFQGRGERAERKIEVIETRRISTHADVCLLEWQGKSYLLLVGQSGVSLIDSNPPERPEQAG
jgi:hypothetical protein